jgi:hypothetical protein
VGRAREGKVEIAEINNLSTCDNHENRCILYSLHLIHRSPTLL